MRLEAIFSAGSLAPHGVAVAHPTLVIADTGHHELIVLDAAQPAAAPLARLGGLGTDAAAEGMLFPAAVAFLAADRLAVADTHNGQLDFYRLLAGAWQYDGNLVDFGVAPAPNYLVDLAVGPGGMLLVLDAQNRRILAVDVAAGAAAVHYQDPAWREPVALAAGGGYLWVADAALHQIFRYDAAMNSLRIGRFGTQPGELRAPRGVDFDAAADRLYVAEADNARVSVFDSNGVWIELAPLPPGTAHDAQRLRLDGNGRLYVADAAASSVYRFDVAAAAASPSLSRRRLDFGAIGIGYRLPLQMEVRNDGNSPLAVQNVTVIGDGFQLDLASPAPPYVVPAGGSSRVTIACAPPHAGLLAGQLRVATDHANAGLLLADLVAEGLAVEPMAMALVLDRSGSMSQSSGALSKIERLRAISTLMVDLISENQLDELTLVPFSSAATVGLPLAGLAPGTVTAAQGVIGGLTAGGATSIGGGLSLALGQLAGSALLRRNVVVLSDGKENTAPLIAGVPVPDGTRVFTVGVGLAALLDVAKLETLATENGGYFQLTDGNDEQLAKFFTQIASDVFGQQIAVDPVLTMRRGQPQEVPFHLCEGDHSALVVLSWDDPGAELDFTLVSPPGVALGSAALTWAKRAPRHVVGKLQLRGSRWDHPGSWKVRVTPQRMPRATEPAVVSVLVASDVHLGWSLSALREHRIDSRRPSGTGAVAAPSVFPPEPASSTPPAGLRRGDNLVVDVALTTPGPAARLLGGQATLRSPALSLTELAAQLAALDIDKLSDAEVRRHYEAAVRKLRSETGGKLTATRRTYKTKAARRGAAVGFRLPLAGPDGIYEVLVRVQGMTAAGNLFQRERTVQVLVRK